MAHLRVQRNQAHVVVMAEILDMVELQIEAFLEEYRDELLRNKGTRILTHNLGGMITFAPLRNGKQSMGQLVSWGWVILLPSTYELVENIRGVHLALAKFTGPKSPTVFVSE
jgi:hypothetical protein